MPHIREIIWYLTFSVWLISLRIMPSRSFVLLSILFYGQVIFHWLPWWLSGWRIRPPMLETWVQSLVLEDPTCRGATKSMYHNDWPRALQPGSCNYWAHVLQLLKPTHPRACAPQEQPLRWEAHTLQLKTARCNSRKTLTATKTQHSQTSK